jgi:spore maturation protein CgeB
VKIVILGLSLSSSWGNGHATTYRALLGVLGCRHDILFLERDQPWYAAHRDMLSPVFCQLAFYKNLGELDRFRIDIESADAVIIGSYVTEGSAVTEKIRPWVHGAFCFYDIDTPITLKKLEAGDNDYISMDVIPLFDIYLSFTAGPTLQRLNKAFGARRSAPLFCCVDDSRYVPMQVERRWDLGYLGTYSVDRQPALERLLLEPARRLPDKRFVVAGPMYPAAVNWPGNVDRIEHLPPDAHPSFYNAQGWTLNITRSDMVATGYSPSVRLFEASACGTPVISDAWSGLETIFRPAQEIVIAHTSEDVLAALSMAEDRRVQLGAAGRMRCRAGHTAIQRAAELEAVIESLKNSQDAASLEPEGVPA